MLKPKSNNPNGVGIIIECKRYNLKKQFKKSMENEDIRKFLRNLVKKSIEQIENKDYSADLKLEGITPIFKYTVVFYKKLAEVVMK